MKTEKLVVRRARAVGRVVLVGLVWCALSGCQSVRDLVAIPFDMAAHVAVETARMPYEAGKLGAQGLVDVITSAVR